MKKKGWNERIVPEPKLEMLPAGTRYKQPTQGYGPTTTVWRRYRDALLIHRAHFAVAPYKSAAFQRAEECPFYTLRGQGRPGF